MSSGLPLSGSSSVSDAAIAAASAPASGVPASAFATSAATAATPSDDELQPWEMDGWVPTTASGSQKTPNMIRNELQRYIDGSSETQTAIIGRMGVNNNSFRRFMNPSTYKGKWSGCQNGTYWAAARLLAQAKYDKDQAAKAAKKAEKATKKKAGGAAAGAKRKVAPGDEKATAQDSLTAPPAAKKPKKSKKEEKADANALMERINGTALDDEYPKVFDSCPEIVKKIKSFLSEQPGVTKAGFCAALGGINNNSLGKFLAGKKQDQCGNITYRTSYVFFEKKRIMEGKPKSARRLKNESEHPDGFSLEKERAGKWFFAPAARGFYF